MIEKNYYGILEQKTRCTICGRTYRLINEDEELQLQCSGSNEDCSPRCNAPSVNWEDLATAVGKETSITDLHLDFLWEAIERIDIDGYRIEVTMEPISGERKSYFLRLQDYWLAQHSMHGDTKAREMIYYWISTPLRRYLIYVASKMQLQEWDIQDIEQSVWLRVFASMKNYTNQYRMWSWVKWIAKKEIFKLITKREKVVTSEDSVRIESEEEQMQEISNIEYWMASEYVKDLMSVLPEQERKIIVDCVFKEKSKKAVAKELKVPGYRVSYLYGLALNKMRSQISSDGHTIVKQNTKNRL